VPLGDSPGLRRNRGYRQNGSLKQQARKRGAAGSSLTLRVMVSDWCNILLRSGLLTSSVTIREIC